jgi:glycosyltransferase involved in cell wall biosynthesis
MRICHVTDTLPPDQSARALLPCHLGWSAARAGDSVSYVSHARRLDAGHRLAAAPLPGPVAWVPRGGSTGIARLSRLGPILSAWHVVRVAEGPILDADIVHIHGGGVIAGIAAWLASRRRKPYVLTLYGPEIWNRRSSGSRRFDLFAWSYRHAAQVIFSSDGLLDRTMNLGFGRPQTRVIYPAVADDFFERDTAGQEETRRALGRRARHVLVNVNRLHPLSGQRDLIDALGELIRTFPDTRLVICGTGGALRDLEERSRAAGVERHITFAGLVDQATVARYDRAADAFVLSSLLDACPTTALEALAGGTPVVATNSPGSVELNELFGIDVAIAPGRNPAALADTIGGLLETGRRVRPATLAMLRHQFTVQAVAAQYSSAYHAALDLGAVPAAAGVVHT